MSGGKIKINSNNDVLMVRLVVLIGCGIPVFFSWILVITEAILFTPTAEPWPFCAGEGWYF